MCAFALTSVLCCSVTIGNVSTFITTNGWVWHIEIDLDDNTQLLFADGNAIRLTDGVMLSEVAGIATQSGYTEGVGEDARFDDITGFTQINDTHVAAADHHNHCLRWVNRLNRVTSPLAGECGSSGNIDGLNARFKNPYAVIRDKNSSTLLIVTDYRNHAVRLVEVITRRTETLINIGLYGPRGISLDENGENLYIANFNYINKYNMESQALTDVAGNGSNGYGDGRLHEAQFSNLRHLIGLSDNLLLVVDGNNLRLRLIDIENDSVTSICNGEKKTEDGTQKSCSLNDPFSLVLGESQIYIGEIRAIRTLPCE